MQLTIKRTEKRQLNTAGSSLPVGSCSFNYANRQDEAVNQLNSLYTYKMMDLNTEKYNRYNLFVLGSVLKNNSERYYA
ncbi:hypothetical protein QPK24_10270 [Paenibacillus polygoni]|uniref:Uncharacterized protein n=1 Tax=Paenibacillus polygoni TaxID=3050112 RepID=A0ABY8X7B2_9BACL|nr:hypothetical protein [Paenibacillus polygoni]WIV21019.1 hypothetical protein QPK24_10270 [Paenibacillus polygoni]